MKKLKLKIERKGQMQTMETIAVLFVFFMILGFCLVFFATLQKSSAQSKIAELHRTESIKLAQSVISMPELHSSRKGVKGVNTLDIIKVQAFSKVLSEDFDLRKGIYEEKLGSTRVSLAEIYPGSREWELYDNSPLEYRSVFNYFVPVSLFNPLDTPSGNYSVGLLRIEYYAS